MSQCIICGDKFEVERSTEKCCAMCDPHFVHAKETYYDKFRWQKKMGRFDGDIMKEVIKIALDEVNEFKDLLRRWEDEDAKIHV